MIPPCFSTHGNETWIAIKVQPKASRNEIGEISGDALKIKVTAPPVDSAANEAVLRLLCEKLQCSKSSIRLHRGANSRHKIIALSGLTAADITRLLRLA